MPQGYVRVRALREIRAPGRWSTLPCVVRAAGNEFTLPHRDAIELREARAVQLLGPLYE